MPVISFRLDNETYDILSEIKEHFGLKTDSELIRLAINEVDRIDTSLPNTNSMKGIKVEINEKTSDKLDELKNSLDTSTAIRRILKTFKYQIQRH